MTMAKADNDLTTPKKTGLGIGKRRQRRDITIAGATQARTGQQRQNDGKIRTVTGQSGQRQNNDGTTQGQGRDNGGNEGI